MSEPKITTDQIAAFMEEEQGKANPPQFTPDMAALNAAAGDPTVWAHELSEMIGHVTGQWIAEETFVQWLRAFGQQVESGAFRGAIFQVANTPLPATVSGDAAITLLQMRDDLTRGFRKAAGL